MYEIFESLLKKSGKKAADVARATGISQTVFSEWKKGKSTPKADKMIKIAEFFGVSVDDLLGKQGDELIVIDNTGKESLSSLINEYPVDSIKLIAKLCKKTRIDNDLTEKAVSNNTGLDLGEYLLFEVDFYNIGLDKIVNVLTYFKIDLLFITGYLTAVLIEQKESVSETDKLLNRLLIDDDFKNEVLKTLSSKSSALKAIDKTNHSLISDETIDNLSKALKIILQKNNENDN